MRKLLTLITTLALPVALLALLAGPARADINAPADGAVLRGNATLSASGASDGTLCANSSSPQTTLQLINSGGTVVFESVQGGTGAKSAGIDTHSYANGAYTARAIERNRSGFVICSNNTKTTNRSVTIDNITQLSYSGATEGAQNTSVTVKATLTDPNLSGSVLANRTVTFSLSGGTSVNGTTNASGVATATLPVSGPPRTATVTASFAQTTFYKGSTASSQFTVEKNASTTTLDAPAPVVHGQATSFTAHVEHVDGNSNPTGTVQFTVDGDPFGAPAPVSGGTATSPSTSQLGTGDHTVGATYSGDGNLLGSSATAVTQTVGKAPTTTTLDSSGSPTVTGEAVTFTATVAVADPGAGQPAGGVQFNVDGDPYGTAVPLTGDTAELTIANLHPGNHEVQATYNGNGDFASSSSAVLTHGVDRAATSVTLDTSDPDAVAGEPLTFTADVDVAGPGAGNPSGVVQFSADGDPIGDPVPLTNGSAVSPPTGLDAGTHQITADYQGDDDFAGATATLQQEVAAAHTTTMVTTSPSPSVFGQPVTIRAVVRPVSPATGTPQGAVQFTIDGEPGAFETLVDGAAQIDTATLSRGSHEISARYFSADPNFVTSTSDPVEHVVNKAATRTTVESSSPTSVFGQPVTFTATVSVQAPGAGSPSGTVTFTDGSTVLGTAPVDSSTGEVASITTAVLTVGQHAVVATYDGDDSFLGSTGSAPQKVNRAQTSLVVDSSVNPAQSGQSVRFTATVSPVAPGAGVPSGTVRFTVNGANLGGPVELSGGQATSSAFASLSPGTYKIEATYAGDARFVGSTGTLDQGAGQNVTKGDTSMTLASDAPSSAYGQPVTFTAQVSAVAPATGKPSGTVQFWEGQKLLGATGLTATGPGTSQASFVTSTLKPGDHAIRAVYVGNFNFNGQTASAVQTVGGIPTVTGIEGAPNPATYGDDVTFTAVVSAPADATATPGGTVTFTDGGTVLGTAGVQVADGHSRASITVHGLGAGTHHVVATYSGEPSYLGSASPAYAEVVAQASTTLTARTAYTDPVHDQMARLTATLTGPDGRPIAGEVVSFSTTQLLDQGVYPLCDATTDADGVATCWTVAGMWQRIEDNGYDARFAGDANFLSSGDHAQLVGSAH